MNNIVLFPLLSRVECSTPINERDSEGEDLSKLFSKATSLLKVSSHRILTSNIKSLHSHIHEINDELIRLKKSQEKLEGGRASALPFIGALIKLFFRWYNDKRLAHANRVTQDLEHQKKEDKRQIVALHNALSNRQEEEIDPTAIFEIESDMRIALQRDFPGKKKYQDLYQTKILPLLQETKKTMTQHPFAAQAAAKGRAALAGLKTLKNLIEHQAILKNSGVSEQQVFLFPQEGAVFKRSSEEAEEEERLVNALFDLMSKQAVVGTFHIQQASAKQFNIEVSQELQARALSPNALSPRLRDAIKKKLSNQDLLFFKKYEATLLSLDPLLHGPDMKQEKWRVELPGKEETLLSLIELQRLYLTDQLPSTTLIGAVSQKSFSLEEHMLRDTPFFHAFSYLPSLQPSDQTLYLCPNLSDPKNQQAYERCERCEWSYINRAGMMQKVDFKTLHLLFIQQEAMEHIQPISADTECPPKTAERQKALDVPWKSIRCTLMKLEEGAFSELTNIQAKPFISEMILMNNLKSRLRNAILDRLTPDAQFNAILTGELQLLDLHGGNLGVAPAPNPEYERFKDLKFSTDSSLKRGSENVNFTALICDYLEGKISPSTIVQFSTEQGQQVQQPLNELPELQKALEARWQFVIFDTDLSLTEDNRVQLQIRRGKEEHLIPFRSVLLETAWKDHPLPEEVVQRLVNSAERDLRVEHWIKKTDAPIYQRLSHKTKESIQQQLAPLIHTYTLSKRRKNRQITTVKRLCHDFVNTLCAIGPSEYSDIWIRLQHDLPEDITSLSPEAVKRRRAIAAQLFPRLTQRQQSALLERQHRRKKYLTDYQLLSSSLLQEKELLAQMQEFLQQPETPLTSVKKQELLKKLDQKDALRLAHPQTLLKFKEKICEECRPSYFNLMKVMYPLIGDAYALGQALSGSDAMAGMQIGLYSRPLEKSINKAHQRFSPHSPEGRLAKELQAQLEEVQEPAFFGHWN